MSSLRSCVSIPLPPHFFPSVHALSFDSCTFIQCPGHPSPAFCPRPWLRLSLWPWSSIAAGMNKEFSDYLLTIRWRSSIFLAFVLFDLFATFVSANCQTVARVHAPLSVHSHRKVVQLKCHVCDPISNSFVRHKWKTHFEFFHLARPRSLRFNVLPFSAFDCALCCEAMRVSSIHSCNCMRMHVIVWGGQ